MSYDDQNIFAKILRGELDCVKVYEDESTLAFMDIMPQTDGHTLVLPKEAAENLLNLSDDGAAACIKTVKKVAEGVKEAMGAAGITVLQLNGAEAGQTVPHIHFHILPGSILTAKPHAREMADPDQLKEIGAKIAACISL